MKITLVVMFLSSLFNYLGSKPLGGWVWVRHSEDKWRIKEWRDAFRSQNYYWVLESTDYWRPTNNSLKTLLEARKRFAQSPKNRKFPVTSRRTKNYLS